MRRALLAVGVLVAVAPIALAQRPAPVFGDPFPIGRPEDVGMSSERLARVKTTMQRYVDRGEVPGVVTLISRHGRVVHFESIGYRDVEARAVMTPDTIFRLASMTKPIVSAAAMTLYEEGEFQLSDPISKWIPEFKNMKVIDLQGTGGNYALRDARTPITIRHLLTQTAGLQNGDGVMQVAFQKIAPRTVPNDTIGDYVRRLAALPLNFEPGTQWHYGAAGIATTVIGRLVEIVSKQPLDEFLAERIFRPLKMSDTFFYVPEHKLARFAALYRPDANKKISIDERPTADSVFFRERTFFSGSGGLVSTASDYLRFQQMMLNGGELNGARILGRKTVELMTSNQTGDFPIGNRGPGHGFGLGVSVVVDVGASGQVGSAGTYGWGGAYGTITFIDPHEDVIGIMMTQIRPNDHLNIRRDFQTLAYQALVGAQQREPASN